MPTPSPAKHPYYASLETNSGESLKKEKEKERRHASLETSFESPWKEKEWRHASLETNSESAKKEKEWRHASLETNSESAKKEKEKSKHQKKRGSEAAPLSWGEQLLQVAAVLLIAAVVYKLTLTAVQWLEETRRPFCDAHQDPVRANCRPCPENGICQDGDFRCIPGFRRQGGRCVPDKQIDRNAQNLAEFVQSKVCEMSGESLCRSDVTTWVPESELWDTSMEEKMGLDAESAWLVHEKALQLVRDKLNIRINDFGLREFECPFALAVTYQPIGCRLRKGIRANMYGILLTGFIMVTVAMYIFRYIKYRRLANRAEEIYMQVCGILEERASSASGETKWVVSSRLRDHLLLPSERKVAVLWKEVEGLVQEDSRIDQYPKLVNGDSRVVWEWRRNSADTNQRQQADTNQRQQAVDKVLTNPDLLTAFSENDLS